MHCPRCRTVGLHEGETDTITVHACGRCGGVWLAPVDADKLLSWVQVLPWREPVHVDCAVCRQPMQGRYVQAANVVVDACPSHGVWFDHRELEHLAAEVARKRGRPIPPMPHPPREAGGDALAGVVAASAVTAFVLASGHGPPPAATTYGEGATDAATVVAEGMLVAPEVAVIGAHVTAEAAGVAVDAGAGVIEAVADGGGEAAVGFVGAIAEFLAGLAS